MDQKFVNNKTTKDLAQTNSIPAIELQPLKITTNLSNEDLEYLENEVLPFAILRNIKTKFEDFSEEWNEKFNNSVIKQFSKSSRIYFRYFHLQNSNITFRNRLISNNYLSKDGYTFNVNEARHEILLTDGEVNKTEKREIKSSDQQYIETHQELVVYNASYLVILDRQKKVSPFGRWEHHDEIQIYMSDRIKLDYLRLYIGSIF